MDVIYGLIPGMIILGLIAVGVLFWAARSGQFDDLEGDAHRILMDDDLKPEIPGVTRRDSVKDPLKSTARDKDADQD